MTVISAYIDLFIWGEMSGGNCPNTNNYIIDLIRFLAIALLF